MAEPCIKGIAFRTAFATLEELYGSEAVAAILERLPPELSTNIRERLLFTGNWYPLAWYLQVYRVAQQVTGRSNLPYELSFRNITKDLGGVYRLFVAVVSPEFVLKRAAKLFSSYYDTGEMEIIETSRGEGKARWSGCTGFDRNAWSGLLGGAEAALCAAGAKNVVFKVVSGGGDGDEHMEVEARWD